MQKILLGILLFILPTVALAQDSAASSSYLAATITRVKLHLIAEASDPSQAVYEVSVKVNGTTYVVLTQSPFGDSTILYAAGRQLLVRIDEDTIIWNDILGRSHEAPIVSRSPLVEISKSQK